MGLFHQYYNVKWFLPPGLRNRKLRQLLMPRLPDSSIHLVITSTSPMIIFITWRSHGNIHLITSTSSGLSSPSLFFQPLSKAGSPARRVLRQAREPSRAGGLQQQELQELDGIPGAALLQVSVMVDPPPQDCLPLVGNLES